jgi:hypothetical protein
MGLLEKTLIQIELNHVNAVITLQSKLKIESAVSQRQRKPLKSPNHLNRKENPHQVKPLTKSKTRTTAVIVGYVPKLKLVVA